MTRDELLDLLTSAACIGRHMGEGHGSTRGDVTDYLMSYPAMRRAVEEVTL